jgi:5'-3' exonuclease
MRCLIDADIVAFASAASAENEEEWIAHSRADQFVENILQATGAEQYQLYLTGKNNFRYQIFPEYKAGRIDTYRPQWEKSTKEHLVNSWNAVWTNGYEADDALGINQSDNTIICTIDKDLDMIPGNHYRWAITRNGVEVSPAREYVVSNEEAIHNFYYQLLVGDPADGIKGCKGIGKVKATGILSGCESEREMFEAVRDSYGCDEEMNLNAQVLWIWRKENDNVLERFKEFYE